MIDKKSTMILLVGIKDIDHEIIARAVHELESAGFPNPSESDAVKYILHTWAPQVSYVTSEKLKIENEKSMKEVNLTASNIHSILS